MFLLSSSQLFPCSSSPRLRRLVRLHKLKNESTISNRTLYYSEQVMIDVKPFCFIIALATSHPFPWKWELHHGIVPRKEDYFDYLPISAALWPALHGLREFLTLTAENVSRFQFDDFKVKRTLISE